MSGYNLVPASFNSVPLFLNDHDTRLRDLAWRNKDRYENRVRRYVIDSGSATWERGNELDTMEIIYNLPNGNIFTKEMLTKIEAIENELFSIEEYNGKYCKVDANRTCVKPTSVLRFFDGTYVNLNPVFYDPSFSKIPAVLYAASQHNTTRDIMDYHCGRKSHVTQNEASSEITRSYLPIGWPLPVVQRTQIENFLASTLKPALNKIQDENSANFEFSYYSRLLFFNDVKKQAIKDLMFAAGSLCFIFLFICFQTGSLWITSLATFSIITSFLGANLIYRIALDYQYFGFFHILSVFIILGIGADDIFVFYDTWMATALFPYPSLAHRLSDCYRRAIGAMSVTSFTTMTAFFASGLSPLLAVQSFGIFSGILVAVNFISVVVFLPTVVIMYHVKFEKFVWPCCRCCPGNASVAPYLNNTEESDAPLEEPTSKPTQPNKIVKYFRTYHFALVTHKIGRWVLLLFFVVILSVFGYFASQLKPDEEEV